MLLRLILTEVKGLSSALHVTYLTTIFSSHIARELKSPSYDILKLGLQPISKFKPEFGLGVLMHGLCDF